MRIMCLLLEWIHYCLSVKEKKHHWKISKQKMDPCLFWQHLSCQQLLDLLLHLALFLMFSWYLAHKLQGRSARLSMLWAWQTYLDLLVPEICPLAQRGLAAVTTAHECTVLWWRMEVWEAGLLNKVAGPAVVTLAAGSRSGLRDQSEVWYYRVSNCPGSGTEGVQRCFWMRTAENNKGLE